MFLSARANSSWVMSHSGVVGFISVTFCCCHHRIYQTDGIVHSSMIAPWPKTNMMRCHHSVMMGTIPFLQEEIRLSLAVDKFEVMLPRAVSNYIQNDNSQKIQDHITTF